MWKAHGKSSFPFLQIHLCKQKAARSICLPFLPPLRRLRPRGHIRWHGRSRSNSLEPPYHKLHSSTSPGFPSWNPKGYLPKYVVSQTWFSSWWFLRDLWRTPSRWNVWSNRQDFFCSYTSFLFTAGHDKLKGLVSSLPSLSDLDDHDSQV